MCWQAAWEQADGTVIEMERQIDKYLETLMGEGLEELTEGWTSAKWPQDQDLSFLEVLRCPQCLGLLCSGLEGDGHISVAASFSSTQSAEVFTESCLLKVYWPLCSGHLPHFREPLDAQILTTYFLCPSEAAQCCFFRFSIILGL